MKVYAGADRPIRRELLTAEHVHGKTGIDGVALVEPQTPLQEVHAVDYIIRTLLEASAPVTLVPSGPLTNIAMAIDREPAILEHVSGIVLMGGAMREGGNCSPSAEFNILVDPHAADIVFRCGVPVISTLLTRFLQLSSGESGFGRSTIRRRRRPQACSIFLTGMTQPNTARWERRCMIPAQLPGSSPPNCLTARPAT
jgi:hypothetical protein